MEIDISPDTPIEELVKLYPEAVSFLSRRGVRCIRCGEPLWCTLGELLYEDGIENPNDLIQELKEHIRKRREQAEDSK
jgi:methionine synthase II (cobalamin-independent)